MATVDEGRHEVTAPRTMSPTNWSTLAVAALVALVVGFGIGWLAFRDTGVPSDVEQLVEDYEQAWLEGDGARAVGYMTSDARFVSPRYVAAGGVSGDDLATHISTSPVGGLEFKGIEHVVGETPYVVVTTGSFANRDGIGVYYIVEEAGELKIAHNAYHD